MGGISATSMDSTSWQGWALVRWLLAWPTSAGKFLLAVEPPLVAMTCSWPTAMATARVSHGQVPKAESFCLFYASGIHVLFLPQHSPAKKVRLFPLLLNPRPCCFHYITPPHESRVVSLPRSRRPAASSPWAPRSSFWPWVYCRQ